MDKDMQLWGLDSRFGLFAILKPTNTQWSRKYYEPGTFSLQLPVAQYSEEIQYIYTPSRPELGMVTQRNFVVTENGYSYVQVSGVFLENELNDKINTKQFIGKGNVEDEITRYVSLYKKDIPLLEISPSKHRGTPTDFQAFGDNVGKKAATILKLHQMAYRINYDYQNNKKIFSIYQGLDRTQSQDKNNFVVFSSSFRNLTKPSVFTDYTHYKNYCMVKGRINDTDIFEFADLSAGGYKKEMYLEGAGVVYDADTMTEQSYRELLRQAGIEELVERHSVINNVEFDTAQSGYEYMVDVDLGDKCDIIINEMNLQLEARITAIYEVIKDGKHTISFEFGNQTLRRR